MPRPFKLTRKIIETLKREWSAGMPGEYAAAAAGIAKRTLFYYLNEAKAIADRDDPVPQNDREKMLLELLDAREMSEAAFIRKHLANIDAKAVNDNGPWQASMTLLERRFPAHFSLRQAQEVTIKTAKGDTIRSALAKLLEDDDEAAAE